jgi:RNA polymerase sigma factor (sigma-70 family)
VDASSESQTYNDCAPRRPLETICDSSPVVTAGPSALLTAQQQSALAERIRSGEPSAEDELVRLFWDRIVFLAWARTRDREAARDVAQDVMLAVVTALRNGHLRDGERLVAFVYGTARNLVNNYLRAHSRLKEDPIDAALQLASMPDAGDNSERVALVRRAVNALDVTDRTILLLTLVEGLKPAEIAGRLGLTSEVVRARKSRALKKTAKHVKRLSRTWTRTPPGH